MPSRSYYIANPTKGYIALMTILILTGILILIAVFFSQSEILVTDFPNKSFDSLQAKEYAKSCVEIALDKYTQNQNYQGNETQNFASGGSCQILTIETNGSDKILKTIGSYKNMTRRMKVIFYFNNQEGKIVLISWQEVKNF